MHILITHLRVLYRLYFRHSTAFRRGLGASCWESSTNLTVTFVALGPRAPVSSFIKRGQWAPRPEVGTARPACCGVALGTRQQHVTAQG